MLLAESLVNEVNFAHLVIFFDVVTHAHCTLRAGSHAWLINNQRTSWVSTEDVARRQGESRPQNVELKKMWPRERLVASAVA